MDITDKGHAYLVELGQIAKKRELDRAEKVDKAILSELWDTREPVGGPVESIDADAIAARLRYANPTWSYVATRDYVRKHIEMLQPDCIERV